MLADAAGIDLSRARLDLSVATYASMPKAILRQASLVDTSWEYVNHSGTLTCSGADRRGAGSASQNLRSANPRTPILLAHTCFGAGLRGFLPVRRYAQ